MGLSKQESLDKEKELIQLYQPRGNKIYNETSKSDRNILATERLTVNRIIQKDFKKIKNRQAVKYENSLIKLIKDFNLKPNETKTIESKPHLTEDIDYQRIFRAYYGKLKGQVGKSLCTGVLELYTKYLKLEKEGKYFKLTLQNV